MKNLKGGIVVLMMTIVAACSSTPSDPHKPEMSVDTGPSQSKNYNNFRSDTER